MENPPIFELFLSLSPLWICFCCAALIFRGLAGRKLILKDWRVCWAFALSFMGCLYIVIAEGAGAMHQLTRGTVLAAWVVVDVVMLVIVVRMHRPTPEKIAAAFKEAWKQIFPAATSGSMPQGWNTALFAVAAALMLFVGWIALTSPPNVWDSMTYHVPRVMHWIQQRSLSDYATNIQRQLELSPGAELQLCTLMLLSGNDWALNMPQWFAFVTCAVMAGFMAERFFVWHFGAKAVLDPRKVRFCGLFAAIIAMTLPAGITDAITTQNDYLATQWLMLMGLFCLLLAQEPGNRLYAAGVAAALALGIANKGTMFINAAPFGLAIALWLFRKSLKNLFALGILTALFALILNFSWMLRNYELFHSPLGSKLVHDLVTLEDHAPGKIAANILRNLSLYCSTPFAPLTSILNHLLGGLFEIIGEPLQDTGSVWHDITFYFSADPHIQDGDGLGGIVTILPPLFAAIFFLVKFKWKSPLVVYFGLLLFAFALFSGYLKWQPWHARLHLPFFMLAAPFAGMVLGWVWRRWCVVVMALFLVSNALLLLYYNFQYPLSRISQEPFRTREERYFSRRPELYPGTAELAHDIAVSGITNVYLRIGVDTWEYPLWVLLKDRGFHGTIQHAFVDGESAVLETTNFDLPGTAIICEDVAPPQQPGFGLLVTYDRWTAEYRGKPENRIKLISNQTALGVPVQQRARLEIDCNVVDQHDQPVTNNIIRLEASGYEREYPVTPAPMELEFPLQPGQNMLRISLVNPPTADQRILTLDNVTYKLAPP